MRHALRLAILASVLFGTPLWGQDIGALYTPSELARAGSVYTPNLRGMWEEDFLSRLTVAERQRAGAVTLHVPLVGAHRAPFDFYALAAERKVFLPISSVKFLDDLSIAIAYYERNGCGMGAVSDYVGLLRERSAELVGPPRVALGVPANALDDKVVDDVAQKLLKSSVYFIAAHEYAHVMYQHASYRAMTAADAQQQETEADAFALEVMRRIAVPPLSMAHFFTLLSRLEKSPADYDNVQQYEAYLQRRATHPVSAKRILAAADAVEVNARSYARLQANPAAWEQRLMGLAGQLREIAKTLDDRAMRRFMTYRAITVDPASLRGGCR